MAKQPFTIEKVSAAERSKYRQLFYLKTDLIVGVFYREECNYGESLLQEVLLYQYVLHTSSTPKMLILELSPISVDGGWQGF